MLRYIVVFILFFSSLSAENEKISLQLQWLHQFQFAGFYVAKEKGYYDEVGLDVDIKEYTLNLDVVDEVVSGRANFGIGRSSLMIEKKRGASIVALCAVYQHSPHVLLTTNPEIKTIKDFKNRRTMITDDLKENAGIVGMLLANKLSLNDLEIIDHSFDYRDLINKKADLMSSYVSNEVYLVEKAGSDYKVFHPKEHGFDFYSDIVFTSKAELSSNFERAKRFQKASLKGWMYAFNNIEETAKLIYEKYNTQNKSLESLIYEGEALKKLALVEGVPFGHLSKERLEVIANVYRLLGYIGKDFNISDFFEPCRASRDSIKIGVLAKRGAIATHNRWGVLSDYLNREISQYNFQIVPLDFEKLEESVRDKEIDFVITNTMYYVLLEGRYGASRIATMKNAVVGSDTGLKEFGGVIFTKKFRDINTIEDLKGKKFAAVSELSFGGWIMGYEEILKSGVEREEFDISFFNTHDFVVQAVLSGVADAGTVRTDTLERMVAEGKIDLKDIKVIAPKSYDDFSFLVSTKLYPEWPIAKLKETDSNVADLVLSKLLTMPINEKIVEKTKITGWTIPLDYSSVHNLLRELRLPPYEEFEFNFKDVFEKYALWFFLISSLFTLWVARYIYIWNVNKDLVNYNKKLDNDVKTRTEELDAANKELKKLAQTDHLTGISNRRHFMELAERYFNLSTRNKTPLHIFSLDLDHFKSINDKYGHRCGDEALIEFSKTINKNLRKSDLFGRVGGEEFIICIENSSVEGATLLAEKLRKSIEELAFVCDENEIKITVSIGTAKLKDEMTLEELIHKSDSALYKAKNSGRNIVIHF